MTGQINPPNYDVIPEHLLVVYQVDQVFYTRWNHVSNKVSAPRGRAMVQWYCIGFSRR